MKITVLFVDDDAMILQTYQRQLQKRYHVDVALGAEEGLAVLAERGPYAVVVSDMRMPGMDGVQFLAKARQIAPDTVRMILTGYADTTSAMEAVNEGRIFRFLEKPCPRDTLIKALDAASAQYHLITAERELLSKTLSSSVKVLIDILSLVNPTAFGRTARVRSLVREITQKLEVDDAWQCEIAALLSQIGCVTIPEATLKKAYFGEELTTTESHLLKGHPQVGRNLITSIPRLGNVAEIVGYQDNRFDGSGLTQEGIRGDLIPIGARILKVALDFEMLVSRGTSEQDAFAELRSRNGWYDPDVLETLGQLKGTEVPRSVVEVSWDCLPDNAILAEEIKTRNGTVLAAAGLEVTGSLRERLKAHAASQGIQEPIKVFVSAAKAAEPAPT